MIGPAIDRGSPRTLLITRNFPPLRGGMERLNERMFHYLHLGDPASALVGPSGCALHAPASACVAEVSTGPLPLALLSGVAQGLAMACRIRPDVVLAGSGLTAPAAVAAARATGAVAAAYLHGLDIVAPSRIYRSAWLPCIRRCRRILVNSRNTRHLAIDAGVEPGRISIVHPGTELPQLDPSARTRFRTRLGIDASVPVLLSVGRLTARKGLAEFVSRSLPSIRAQHPQATLVIIGDQAPNALHRGRGAGIAHVQAAARAHGVAEAVTWLGPCSDDELSDAYQGADLHVFPVRDMPGDVEGFGMVAIEAAAHGLPTIAFDVGGVGDAVAEDRNGHLIPADDYEAFGRAVNDHLAIDSRMAGMTAIMFARRFGWDRFGRELIAALAVD